MEILLQAAVKKSLVASRPEVELLLCCARTHVDSETAERIIILLQNSIDWAFLIEIANQHGVMPLLYWSLKATCPEAVPKDIWVKLQTLFHAHAAYNRFLTSQLLDLLNMFKDSDISAIPFKGPALANSVYGNLVLRQFCDLDILFHKSDILTAKNLLIAQRYENAEKLTYEQEIAQLQSPYVKAYTYKSNKTPVMVELHWQLRATYSSFPINYEGLWERMIPVSLADTPIFNLSPEDEILYLCAHGCGDRWQKFLQICDIAEAIRTHQTLNWQQMLEQASRLGCRRRLFLGLFLSKELLQTNLPAEVWQKIQADSAIKWLGEWVCQRLFRQPDESPKVLDQALFDLVSLERLQDKGRYLRDRLILLIVTKFRLGFARKYGLPGGKLLD